MAERGSIMTNTLFDTITVGTKILMKFMENDNTVEKEEVVTIASIKHYNKNLYDVTFKEPHMKGCYSFSIKQLIEMKKAYDEM